MATMPQVNVPLYHFNVSIFHAHLSLNSHRRFLLISTLVARETKTMKSSWNIGTLWDWLFKTAETELR